VPEQAVSMLAAVFIPQTMNINLFKLSSLISFRDRAIM